MLTCPAKYCAASTYFGMLQTYHDPGRLRHAAYEPVFDPCRDGHSLDVADVYNDTHVDPARQGVGYLCKKRHWTNAKWSFA